MTSAEALQVLGLAPGASAAQARRAYRKLALLWHPDGHALNPGRRKQAEERFKVISAAYQHVKAFGTAAPGDPSPPRSSANTSRPGGPYRAATRPSAAHPPVGRVSALPQAPWWVRPVSFQTAFTILALLRLASCFHDEPWPRLSEPPSIPEIRFPRGRRRGVRLEHLWLGDFLPVDPASDPFR
jgi:hypothetical protein